MKRVTVVAGMILFSMWLVAQADQSKVTPGIPKTCSERNLLRDDKGKVVWFTHEQMKGRATKMVVPEMSPLVSRAARIEGTVIVQVVVGKDGRVACSWILRGHPILAGDVLKAAQRWEFKPEVKEGKPIAFAGYLEFRFKYGYSI